MNSRAGKCWRWTWKLAASLIAAVFLICLLIVAIVACINIAGRSFASRAAVTRSNATTVMTAAQLYTVDTGTPAPSLAVLVPKYLVSTPLDGWGNPFVYTLDRKGVATITSLGADGAPGGTGANADLSWHYVSENGQWVLRQLPDSGSP